MNREKRRTVHRAAVFRDGRHMAVRFRCLHSFPPLAAEVYSSLFLLKLNLQAQKRPTLEAFRPN